VRSAHLAAQRDEEHTFALAGAEIVADPSGALYWPDERMLVVADLHLEKGSAFAKRGVLLPPYDTASTLARLAGVLLRYAPRSVVALGDSFHDGDGPRRMSSVDETTLRTLRGGRDWIWIAGNHDAELPRDLGGSFAASLAVGPLIFRHLPLAGVADGEASGRATEPERPLSQPALLHQRRPPPRHARFRGLCRRAEHTGWRIFRAVRHPRLLRSDARRAAGLRAFGGAVLSGLGLSLSTIFSENRHPLFGIML
jgi:DNA ligase-associated metallophosphoesterase